MWMALFLTLMGIAAAFVALGYYSKESLYSLIGFFFIFLLSSTILLPGNLEYNDGVNSTTTFSYLTNSTTISSITDTMTYTKTAYDETSTHAFGVWLSIMGVFGMVLSMIDIKGLKEELK